MGILLPIGVIVLMVLLSGIVPRTRNLKRITWAVGILVVALAARLAVGLMLSPP